LFSPQPHNFSSRKFPHLHICSTYSMEEKPPLRTDPYVLAYRYHEYMSKYPTHRRENPNTYYTRLLANQPDPDLNATDDRSRAICYAKKHYECFYELRDIKRVVEWLNKEDA
jgi:hypothetical protein